MKGKYLVIVLALLALPAAALAQIECTAATAAPDRVELSAEGHLGVPFTVLNSDQCFWKVTGIEGDWITLQSYRWLNGARNTVTYDVSVNDGAKRTGTISVDGRVVHTVVQDAMPCGVFRSGNALTGSDLHGVYVANTDCGKVIQVDDDGDGWHKIYEEAGSTYEGLLYGPDALLYALDTTAGKIVRFAPEDAVPTYVHTFSPPASPRLAAFNNRGDLIIVDHDDATNRGLRYLRNTAAIGDDLSFSDTAVLIDDSDLLGGFTDVITLANGDLLAATSAGGVYRFPFTPAASPPYGAPTDVAPSLGSTSAIARAANGTVFIAEGNTIHTFTFNGDGDLANRASCATFGDASTVADMDLSADDSLYVTTLTPDAITGDNQGELWEIRYYNYANDTVEFGCQAKSLLATFAPPSPADGDTPLVGVAVPFTTRAGKPIDSADNPEGVPEDSQLFNFFDSVYEFRPPAEGDGSNCSVNVTATEMDPADVLALIPGSSENMPVARPITFFGDNGRALGYHYTPKEEQGVSCPNGLPAIYEHAINAYYSGGSPRIMLCHGDLQDQDCEIIDFRSYYPGVGFFPDDGRIGGTNPNFSTAFLVDTRPETVAGAAPEFCGFQSPLTNLTDPADPSLPVFNGGSDMPVKFTVADTANGGDCKNGPYKTEGVYAILSMARVDPASKGILELIKTIDITGGGSYNPESGLIYFDDPNNKNKPFALQIKLSQDGVPLPAGTYEVAVTDLTDGELHFQTGYTYFVVKP